MIGVFQCDKLGDQCFRFCLGQAAVSFDSCLAGQGGDFGKDDTGSPADALTDDLLQYLPEQTVCCLSKELGRNGPDGEGAPAKVFYFISHCGKNILKLPVGIFLLPAQAQYNRGKELLGGDENRLLFSGFISPLFSGSFFFQKAVKSQIFLRGSSPDAAPVVQGGMLSRDPVHHPLIIDFLMRGMLIDDQELFFIFDQPVGVEYLSDQPETGGIFPGEQEVLFRRCVF